MYFGEEKMPIRLCYMGNTFLNNSSYQGRLKESTQLGAELLGDSTVDADAEIIAMVIDCLKKQIKRVSAFRRSCRIFPRFDRCGSG